MELLPRDIFRIICQGLPIRDFRELSKTSRVMFDASQDPLVWAAMYQRDFSNLKPPRLRVTPRPSAFDIFSKPRKPREVTLSDLPDLLDFLGRSKVTKTATTTPEASAPLPAPPPPPTPTSPTPPTFKTNWRISYQRVFLIISRASGLIIRSACPIKPEFLNMTALHTRIEPAIVSLLTSASPDILNSDIQRRAASILTILFLEDIPEIGSVCVVLRDLVHKFGFQLRIR